MSETKTEKKIEENSEQKALLERCKRMKEAQDYQKWLKTMTGKFPNEDTEMLYRLPLSNQQRKALYNNLMSQKVS